jgi:hypothetical protein
VRCDAGTEGVPSARPLQMARAMAQELYGVYLEGDPEIESTRRHMERVLRGEPRRRWPWLLGLLAGGTAFTLWRSRRTRQASTPHTPHRTARATR